MTLLGIVVPIGLLTGIAVSVLAAWMKPHSPSAAASAAIAVSKPVHQGLAPSGQENAAAKDQTRPEGPSHLRPPLDRGDDSRKETAKLELVEERTDLTVPPPLPTARPIAPQASGVQWDYRYRHHYRWHRKRRT